MARAAIVIGVNKTTSLTELKGAVLDANRFSEWINKQGFETKKFIDEPGRKVTFSEIFDQIKAIVEARTYTQLVIYFAGHGFQNGGSEVWLLSGAPGNAREAIGLEASILAARESGIASVVIISDACRSIPATLQDNRVDGGPIFPNVPLDRTTRPEVDRFFATLPSLVAVAAADANDDARRNGVFTTGFLRAYRNTAAQFVLKLTENGSSVEVVTNRNLKKLLQIPVEDAAHAVAPKAGQLPDAIIESDNAYVGRVERSVTTLRGGAERPERAVRPSAVSVAAVAQEAIADAARPAGTPGAPTSAEGQAIDELVGLSKTIDQYADPLQVDRFESETGFSVTGASVAGAWSPSFRIEKLDGQTLRLWAEQDQPAGSVLVRFSDGTGTIVAGLHGYIGHILVDNGVVANVNFVPATNNRRWPEWRHQIRKMERLRAAVAAAAGLGVFRVEREDAEGFADRIRELKGADPTLGLYAAYAYSSAGLGEKVESVREFMYYDLSAELFDIAMLARRNVVASECKPHIVVPVCPMLRQGWSLVGVRKANLSHLMREARQWLRPGLWTTFASEGMALLIEAAENGRLQ
jgi:hypothetical protein